MMDLTKEQNRMNRKYCIITHTKTIVHEESIIRCYLSLRREMEVNREKKIESDGLKRRRRAQLGRRGGNIIQIFESMECFVERFLFAFSRFTNKPSIV